MNKYAVNYSNGNWVVIGTMTYPLSNDGKYVDYGFDDLALQVDAGQNKYIMFSGRIRYIAEVVMKGEEVV